MRNEVKSNDFNSDIVSKYLKAHIPKFGTGLKSNKFKNGQSNPTYLLETDRSQYVLRRKPHGKLLPSAHAIDREFRVMNALAHTDVPVPKMLHFCDDDTVIGSAFYIMEHIEGRIFWDQTLPGFNAEERMQMFDEMNRLLAALHNVNLKKMGLVTYGKPENFFKRQMDRWTKQYRAAQTEVKEDVEDIIKWLNRNLPEDDGQLVLIHGDYRMDNIMFCKQKIEAVALLDWELSTLGHPVSDLAYQCAQWRLPPGKLTRGLSGLDRKSLGIPSEEEYIEKYCMRRGLVKIDDWIFTIVFSLFRLLSILQGVKKRYLLGNASNTQAKDLALFISPLAHICVQIIETEG